MTSSLLTHTKLKAELTIQCKNGQSNNASTQLSTFGLSKSTRLVGKKIPALLLQFLVNQLSSVSPVLAPDLKGGVARSKVTQHSQAAGVADAPPTIHLR